LFVVGLVITCFGRPHAHHQELNNCSSNLQFYLRSVVIEVMSFVVGPFTTGPTTTNSTAVTTRYCYLPLSWKSLNRFECSVGGVRHPQNTQ
jgi:hypothetical protein